MTTGKIVKVKGWRDMTMKKMEQERIHSDLLEALVEVDRICRKHGITYYIIGGTLIGAVRHKGFIPWDDDIDIAMMREDYERFLTCYKDDLNKKFFFQNYSTDVDFYPPISRICIPNTFIDEYYSRHLKFNKSLYLDIFPLDNIPDDEKLRNEQRNKIDIIDKLIFYKLCMVYNKGFLNSKLIVKKVIQFLLLPLSLEFLQNLREKVMKEYSNQQTMNVCNTGSKYGYMKGIDLRDTFGEPVLLEFEGLKFFAPMRWDVYLSKIYGDYMEMPSKEKRIQNHEVYEI